MDASEIEEANRLRIAMGMKPLPVPGAAASQPKPPPEEEEDPSSTFEGRQAQAYENYQKVRDADAAKKKREERAAQIKRARELAQRSTVLQGKGLGEADDEEDLDAKAWLKSQKKRQKKIGKVRQQEEEAERAAAEAAAARSYSSRDLAGVKVGHDMSTLLDDGEQVLTLKDTTVLENEEEGDELENADLRDQEKVDERLNLKKKKPVYDPNDVDETAGHSILAQYDEEISGKKRKAFTLDSQGNLADVAGLAGEPAEKATLNSLNILDVLDEKPASDYLDVSEFKVKKPRKKKSKSTRRRPVDEDDMLFPAEPSAAVENGEMDIDSGDKTFSKKRKMVDEPLLDDDDLQASLAAQRRDALKSRRRMRPQDIAKQLREEAQTPGSDVETAAGAGAGGLVIDEMSEFIGALKNSKDDEERRPAERKKTPQQSTTAMEDDESDDDGDTEMANVDQDADAERETLGASRLTTTGVEEEKTVAQGMGTTLQMLRERGLMEEAHGADLNAQYRDHHQFLAEKNRRLAKIEEDARRQRERDRASGLLDRMSVREREEYARKQNTQRDFQASRVLNDMFNRDYRPTFDLKYTDEHGRQLDRKEAFKHLSHQFHGKGSGKGKTDKLLKKIDAEKRQEAQSILDNSKDAGLGSAQPRKRKEAGVRLA